MPPNDEINSSSDEEINSSFNDAVDLPPNDEINSSSDEEINSSSNEEIDSSPNGEVNSSFNDAVDLPPNDEINSSSDEEINSSSNEEIDSSLNGEVNSSFNDLVDLPPNDEINSSSDEEINSSSNEEIDSSPNGEVNSSFNNAVDLPTNDEINSSSEEENNSSSNEEIDSSPNGEVNSSFNDVDDLSALEETDIIEETPIPIEKIASPIAGTDSLIDPTDSLIKETDSPSGTDLQIEITDLSTEESELTEERDLTEEIDLPEKRELSEERDSLEISHFNIEAVLKGIDQYFAGKDQESNGFAFSERDRIDSPITFDNMYDEYNLSSPKNSRSNGSNDRLFQSSGEPPLFDDDLFSQSEEIHRSNEEIILTIDDRAKRFPSLIQTSQAVERASSLIINPNPSGSPRFFLEQVHETWIVRNPEEKYIGGKNPNKHDATSSINENTKKAREQQIEKEAKIRNNLDYEFGCFIERFSFAKSKQMIRDPKKWSEFIELEILTDKEEATGETVKKLHNHSYGVSFTQGLRPTMEDAHAAFLLDGHPCFAIFDGHGSPYESNYCAQNMQRVLQDFLTKNHAKFQDLNDAELILFFKKSFVLLDNEVKSLKSEPKGTTVALNVIIGNRIICINLGDSRTVIIKSENEAVQISKDAKCNDPKYSKKINALGGYIDESTNRVMNHRPNPWIKDKDGAARLTVPRDIGGCGIKSVSPVLTLTHYPVGKYMIIACDGLWDVMTPFEAGEFLNLMESKGFDVDAMSQALVKMALVRESKDNISVMVIRTTP